MDRLLEDKREDLILRVIRDTLFRKELYRQYKI